MKTNMLTLASAAALTMAISAPAFAAPTSLSDAALDAVSGKGQNNATVAGSNTTSVTGSTLNGNIQVGFYQWSDDHSADQSTNKGGNLQSGNNSMVQQNGSAIANTLAWGAVAQSITDNQADIGGEQVMEDWATMYIGGF